jgi:hypothetical protein
MSEEQCRNCRHSIARQFPAPIGIVLWCHLRKAKATQVCPGYEREPGTEQPDE